MARRGTPAEQYLAIAAFYGLKTIEDIENPVIPEFILVQAARHAAHFAWLALLEQEKLRRKEPAGGTDAPGRGKSSSSAAADQV